MRRTKSLECDFSGEACYNPRCKVGLCMEERKFNLSAAHEKTKPLDRELAKVAKRVAMEIARLKGIKSPTPDQIARAIRHPRVLAEAKRRLGWD
jgi:hypothetical protein